MKTANHVLLVAALCYSTLGVAASIDLHWDAHPLNPASPAGPFGFSVTPGGIGSPHTGSVYPDRYHGTITSSTNFDPLSIENDPDNSAGLFTYCYELTQFFYATETVTYEIVDGSTGITGDTLDFLGGVNSVLGGPYGWLHPTNANMAAAIQLGIWETLYDAGHAFNLSSGNFFLTSGSLGSGATSVAGYLNAFEGAAGTSDALPSTYAVRLSNTSDPYQRGAGAQDQITGRFPPSTQRESVPEPGSFALVGIGMLVTAVARRRSNKSALAA